jgi:hypothetical protein
VTPSGPFAGVEPRLPPVLDIAQMTLLSPKLRIGRHWTAARLERAPSSPPSLAMPQPSPSLYIPPPINNPSERIKQLNESFPLNGGLGNNPTNRDDYIRYNLTR